MGKEKQRISIHSIQTKILLICLAIALGTTMASLLISYYAEINTIKETTERYMTQYISFADRNFNDMLEEAEKISLSIAAEQEVILPGMGDVRKEASYGDYQQKKRIRSFLNGLMSQKDYIDNILLVTKEGRIYQASSELIMKKDLNMPIMQKALSFQKAGILFDRQEEVVLFCRPVIYAGKTAGINMVRLNYESLISVYQTEPLKEANIYIYGPEGDLFYTNAAENGKEEELYRQVSSQNSDTGYLYWNGEKQYYIGYGVGNGGMSTISLMPYQSLLKDANTLRRQFFLIGAGAVLFAAATAVYFSGRLCTNLHLLMQSMEEIQSGNLTIRSHIQGQDEIGVLSRSFNHMVERIGELLEEVRQKEKLKREAQQNVLATQIEPHFLYNSIDSIQHVAHMRKETEIEQVAGALSELLRSVLSDRNEFITLWEEREYIENYITIERFKYRIDFELLWDVDEQLWTWKVPKLLLQPVVENALIHGISTRESGGVIQIKICRQEELVIVKILDNGKGMSQEKIEQLLSEVQKTDKSGFRRVGFANVMNRIRLIYGEEYGGTIYSCEGLFTCVELTLPAEGGEDGTFSFNRG